MVGDSDSMIFRERVVELEPVFIEIGIVQSWFGFKTSPFKFWICESLGLKTVGILFSKAKLRDIYVELH
jgi:hypothetical protein